MKHKDNAKWLTWLAPFQGLSISAGYLTPFFLQHGLSMAQILLLQSLFTCVLLVWEVPSGYLADKIGRAWSIRASVGAMGVGIVLYSLGSYFWQFMLGEMWLALAVGLGSGADTALLLDSLHAENSSDYVRLQQRINAAGFAASAAGVPLGLLLVHFIDVRSTLFVDGLLTIVGLFFAWRLVEAPKVKVQTKIPFWQALAQLATNAEVRWIALLGAVLNAITYLTFWLSAVYYQGMGISIIWFGTIFAIRSLWKAWLSHGGSAWIAKKVGKYWPRLHRTSYAMVCYALLAGLVCAAASIVSCTALWRLRQFKTFSERS